MRRSLLKLKKQKSIWDTFAFKKSPHETLGVNANSSHKEVHERYKELIKTMHPDRGGDPEQFQEIRQAYEIIMRSQKESSDTHEKSFTGPLKQFSTLYHACSYAKFISNQTHSPQVLKAMSGRQTIISELIGRYFDLSPLAHLVDMDETFKGFSLHIICDPDASIVEQNNTLFEFEKLLKECPKRTAKGDAGRWAIWGTLLLTRNPKRRSSSGLLTVLDVSQGPAAAKETFTLAEARCTDVRDEIISAYDEASLFVGRRRADGMITGNRPFHYSEHPVLTTYSDSVQWIIDKVRGKKQEPKEETDSKEKDPAAEGKEDEASKTGAKAAEDGTSKEGKEEPSADSKEKADKEKDKKEEEGKAKEEDKKDDRSSWEKFKQKAQREYFTAMLSSAATSKGHQLQAKMMETMPFVFPQLKAVESYDVTTQHLQVKMFDYLLDEDLKEQMLELYEEYINEIKTREVTGPITEVALKLKMQKSTKKDMFDTTDYWQINTADKSQSKDEDIKGRLLYREEWLFTQDDFDTLQSFKKRINLCMEECRKYRKVLRAVHEDVPYVSTYFPHGEPTYTPARWWEFVQGLQKLKLDEKLSDDNISVRMGSSFGVHKGGGLVIPWTVKLVENPSFVLPAVAPAVEKAKATQ